MTISKRIFKRLESLKMTQAAFADQTGIAPSTISEWKKSKVNPSSDKIMIICHVLDVTPEWLLSGVEPAGGRKDRQDFYIIDKMSDLGKLVSVYNRLNDDYRSRMLGCAAAFGSMSE